MPPAFHKILTTKPPQEPIIYRPLSAYRNREDDEDMSERILYKQHKSGYDGSKQTYKKQQKHVADSTEAAAVYPIPTEDESFSDDAYKRKKGPHPEWYLENTRRFEFPNT